MQKYAILSDIHSNVFALTAVVKHAHAQGVTQFINLGDILYGPIAPKATYEFLQSLDAVTICGNQDRQIFQATPPQITSNPTMQFILNDLGDEPIEWMKKLPFDKQITDQIYACHGTPKDDLVYLLEDTLQGDPQLRSDEEIVNLLSGNDTAVILCGHTHIPRCVELSTGQLIINPGSVGMPAYTDDEPHLHSMQTYSSLASYAMLTESDQCQWNVSFHKVAYDVAAATEQAALRKREDWVHFLTTGRGR
ncbi:metallophosphatase family protein [Vibrio kasasachensis]|uniref:metallophosphoesterase family protein n=1 Tax=Vibrio kasasachensis TaxID=2910248 RepID=UPI003D0C515B